MSFAYNNNEEIRQRLKCNCQHKISKFTYWESGFEEYLPVHPAFPARLQK